ncbi:hypothetical protein J4E93_008656 [Alternaria ventricosa]|uniref:uncharacterized protein n=1 Tax=Alternaria ventricosa TaxID=1187951 RepID=UPI0020C2C548|nr:uncharacterized protein J4E93_008656 [Alternaria ventricosa]KAI4640450.1 hypothetical protein J4E93_008656 [Alternaria ventricosa]
MQNPPNRTSRPADPSAVSFLTTLPAEIRNCVYELLFKREDPVLLHNADVYHASHPFRGALEDYYSEYEDGVGKDEAFRHDFHEGLALLSSCRQIHDEASGILYGGNTFIFSRLFDEEDCDELNSHEEYSQVDYAAKWLNEIETQFNRLKKVVIDVNATCCEGLCADSDVFEFLPLLRFVWKNPDSLKIISFGSASGALYTHEPTFEAADRDGEPWVDRARMFNNLLTAFAVHDVLDIRKYAFSNHLMSEIRILQFPERELGGAVGMRDGNEIVIDLNTHTVRGLDFGIARTGLVPRRTLGELVSRLNRISIKMTSKKPVTDFDGFKKLDDLLSKRSNHPTVLGAMLSSWPEPHAQTLVLEIAPAEVTALSTVRIDIKDLITLLRDGYPHRVSTICITLTPPSHTGAPQQSTTVSTEKLLRQTFLLLSDYILQAEEELSESPGINTVKALLEELDPFPELWIDGYGNLLHASTADMDAPLKFPYAEFLRPLLQTMENKGKQVAPSTEITSACVFAFSNPFAYKKMESCYTFRTWAGETLTIACAIGLVASIAGILAVYDGKPVPDWGSDLNLNALIALLSTVLRALLVVTVAQIISQRKWDWFSVTSARPLSDIQRFDYGSRGAYGALLLIPTVFLKDFVTLAAAVVLLLSFLVGPFAQQANGGSDGGPTTDLVAAILSSVVSPYGIENKIRTSCPTGNCTFSNLGPRPELEKAFFDSNQSMHSKVGMCNICTNVASLVTSKIESTEWSNNTVHSLPSGLNLSVGAGHFEVSTMKPTPDLTWMGSLLTDSVREASRWAYINATLLNIGSTPITASVCSLYPCTRTYKSTIKDSELHEWEAPSSAMRLQIPGAHHEELDLPTSRNSLSNTEYSYTTRREPCRVGPWTLYSGGFIPEGTATAELQLFDFTHEKYSFENMTWPEQCIYRQPAEFVKAVAMVMNDDIFDGYCQSYKTFDCFKNCKNSEFCQLEIW